MEIKAGYFQLFTPLQFFNKQLSGFLQEDLVCRAEINQIGIMGLNTLDTGFFYLAFEGPYLPVREWLCIPLTVVLCEDLDGGKTKFIRAVYGCGYTPGN